MYTRATLLSLAFAGLSLSALAADAAKPNILVIVADDLGYGELGLQGFTKEIATPHIDSIAANGTRFTSGYVSGTYCSPTRAGLLTGRYQQRFGHEFNPGPATTAEAKVGLDLAQKTLGDRLRGAGYTTAWIGKSHLGYEPEFHPLKRGFDHFYGFLGGAHSYLDADGGGRDPVQNNGQPVAKVNYLTEELGQEAGKFIASNKGKPWFTYLAFNAVHGPLEATEKYLARYSHLPDPKRQKFAAMLSAMDDAVGSVLTTLRETGQEENTLIFFIADNGGPTPSITSGNGPLRGYKAQTWEGGIRVAWLVQWKGHLPAGKVDDRPVIQLDILPTALAASGAPVAPEWKVDGVNLLPYLQGENAAAPHDALYWRFGQQLAVRQGDWKLVKAPGGALAQGNPVGEARLEGAQLYNLAQDIGEKNDLAAQYPEKVKELGALWAKWNESNVPPAWAPGIRKQRQLSQRLDTPVQPAAAPSAPKQTASAAGPWKSGDSLSAGEAPVIAGKPLRVSARIDATVPEGVILAHGGQGNGVALLVHEGKLAFAVRSKRQLTVVQSNAALATGQHQVEARLDSTGKIVLLVDGQPAGDGQAPALLASQPKDGLSVGRDAGGAVGEYEGPHPFSGKVENATLQLLP